MDDSPYSKRPRFLNKRLGPAGGGYSPFSGPNKCSCARCRAKQNGAVIVPAPATAAPTQSFAAMTRIELEALASEQRKKLQELERVKVLYENLQKVGLLR